MLWCALWVLHLRNRVYCPLIPSFSKWDLTAAQRTAWKKWHCQRGKGLVQGKEEILVPTARQLYTAIPGCGEMISWHWPPIPWNMKINRLFILLLGTAGAAFIYINVLCSPHCGLSPGWILPWDFGEGNFLTLVLCLRANVTPQAGTGVWGMSPEPLKVMESAGAQCWSRDRSYHFQGPFRTLCTGKSHFAEESEADVTRFWLIFSR